MASMASTALPAAAQSPHPNVFRPHPNVILDQFARETRGHVHGAWDELTRLGAYGSATGECTLTRAILRIPQNMVRAFASVPAARRLELATVALRVVYAWKSHDEAAPLTRHQWWVLDVTEVGWRALLDAAVSDVLANEIDILTRLLQAMRVPFVPGVWGAELIIRPATLGCDTVVHYRRGTAHARVFGSALEAALGWLADQVRAHATV